MHYTYYWTGVGNRKLHRPITNFLEFSFTYPYKGLKKWLAVFDLKSGLKHIVIRGWGASMHGV